MQKYRGIQILRFIAATLVVAEHLIGNIITNWANSAHYSIPPIGAIGVIVFFGVSGFIMISTQYDSFGSQGNALNFIWRRLLRIWPIYAIATTLQLINKMNAGGDYTAINYIKSLLFIPYLSESGLYRPILGQGWTLNVEMFFYVVFAVSLIFNRARGILLSVLFFSVVAFCRDSATSINVALGAYATQMLLYFVCGMLVGLACKQKIFRTTTLMLPIVVWSILLSASVWINSRFDGPVQLLFNLILVASSLYIAASYRNENPGTWVRFFEQLGDASYSTYLFHGFMLGALKALTNHVHEGQFIKFGLLTVFAIVLGNLLGLAIFNYLETPLSRAIKTFLIRRSRAAA